MSEYELSEYELSEYDRVSTLSISSLYIQVYKVCQMLCLASTLLQITLTQAHDFDLA